MRKVLISFLVAASIISLFVGPISLDFTALVQGDEGAWHILTYSRIPRLMSVLVSGAGLALSGMIMQKLMHNRFVSPSTAVTVDAIRFGLAAGMVLLGSLSFFEKMAFGFTFSFAGTLLFVAILHKIQRPDPIFTPLIGIILGMILEGITTFIAVKYDFMQVLGSYFSGSFTLILEGRYELLYLCIPAMICAGFYIRQFNILSMGEDFAKSIGVNVRFITVLGIALVAFITTTVLTNVGVIPFLGLVIPNLSYMMNRKGALEDITSVALMGALLLLLCDILARLVIFPYEIPVGLVMGFVGSGLFLTILMRYHHERS